jgi:hypothetical protein
LPEFTVLASTPAPVDSRLFKKRKMPKQVYSDCGLGWFEKEKAKQGLEGEREKGFQEEVLG